jgi:hypothetical protein
VDEMEILHEHWHSLGEIELPVICGRNLACDNWKSRFESRDSVVNGITSVLGGMCRSDSHRNLSCFVVGVSTSPPPPPGPQIDGGLSTLVLFGIVGGTLVIVIAIVVGIAVYVIQKRKLLAGRGTEFSLVKGTEYDLNA